MLKNLFKGNQFLKWLLVIVAGFFVVFGSVSLYVNIRIKPILALHIKELVEKSTEGLYSIKFTELNVNCLTGDANLNYVQLVPDTAVLRRLVLLKKAPNNIYHIQLRKLSIRNVHPYRVYRQKKLDIDEIEILRPKITMINKQYAFNENRPPRPYQSPYEVVSKYLKQLHIATINFREVNFKYVDNNQSKPVIDSLEHLNVTLNDWLIDENSAKDTTRFYLLKELQLQLHDYRYATADSLYTLKVGELDFTGSTGKLHLKNLALVPRESEMEFGKAQGFSRDRFNIQLNDIQLEGMDFPLFVKKQELYARVMRISDGNFHVFKNKELPEIESNKIGQYPHQLLQKLQTKLTIEKLDLQNINFSYGEFSPYSKQKGKITFEKTSGTITHISNVGAEKDRHPVMEANLNTLMMGQGSMEVKFNFNLKASDGAFSYAGVLHGLDGSVMNRVTKPLGMLHIKNGMVQELRFDIKANDHRATGTMDFRYKDLAISVLKKEKGRQGLSRQGLLSFLANNLVINADNPDNHGVFTRAKIDYPRKPTRSFFNLVWKSLFQGIRHSVGVTPEKEAHIKAQIAKFEKMKEEREKRKAARERRKSREK
jgi:hypothetical protein